MIIQSLIKAIRITGVILMITLVFFSATGIAIYHHICGCQISSSEHVVSTAPIHSCCQTEEQNQSHSMCCDGNHQRCDSENHRGCRDRVTYLKAPIISTIPLQERMIKVIPIEMPDFLLSGICVTDIMTLNKPHLYLPEHPPPAENPLFILFHQIRIPSPEDHCS